MKIIILCAGKGRRFNINKPKCLINVYGKSLIKRCVQSFKYYGFSQKKLLNILLNYLAECYCTVPLEQAKPSLRK